MEAHGVTATASIFRRNGVILHPLQQHNVPARLVAEKTSNSQLLAENPKLLHPRRGFTPDPRLLDASPMPRPA